ncbi:hypothetical protein MTO96_020548 [Rhipicephalus appendiculatus]
MRRARLVFLVTGCAPTREARKVVLLFGCCPGSTRGSRAAVLPYDGLRLVELLEARLRVVRRANTKARIGRASAVASEALDARLLLALSCLRLILE